MKRATKIKMETEPNLDSNSCLIQNISSRVLNQHRKCGLGDEKKSGRLDTRDSFPGKTKGIEIARIILNSNRQSQRSYNPHNDTVRTNMVKLAPTSQLRGSQDQLQNQGSLFSLTPNPWHLWTEERH